MAAIRSFQVPFSALGAMSGCKVTHPAITTMKNSDIINAGRIPARKRRPMDCST